ncbi:MAG: glycosyltransferase family 2 protein [Verrucomicrobia bacterium]|nr:glycosyltransferase family 2 protein [Verrucomicrobiota bacterium]
MQATSVNRVDTPAGVTRRETADAAVAVAGRESRLLLSVVFSFRNEEEVLPELIRRLRGTLNPLDLDYELVFVNDASTDGSLEVLLKLHEEDPRIKIINMSRRFGVSPCVIAGLRHTRGDAVVYMDADLQDPPELIPQLLEKFREGHDVVHTTRTKRLGEGRFKMWLTKQAYKTINAVSDIDIPENTGDFKLLSRRAVNQLLRLGEYDPFMRGLVRWIGFKQAHVFYERDRRFAGETHFSLLRSINPIREFIRGLTSFSEWPLYFALIVGFIVSAGAFAYLVGIVITTVFFGMHNPGWPALMVTLLFLGGTILFTIGILGIYIGRIHQDLKRRPPYIVESKIGIQNEGFSTDCERGRA